MSNNCATFGIIKGYLDHHDHHPSLAWRQLQGEVNLALLVFKSNGNLWQWHSLSMAMFADVGNVCHLPHLKGEHRLRPQFQRHTFPPFYLPNCEQDSWEVLLKWVVVWWSVSAKSPVRSYKRRHFGGLFHWEWNKLHTSAFAGISNFGWNFFSVFRIGRFVTKQRFSNSFPKEFGFCLQFVPKETKSLWVYQEKMVRYIPRKAGSGL